MFANQIFKHLSEGEVPWRTEKYSHHKNFIRDFVQRNHQFYLGEYSHFRKQMTDQFLNRRLFMGNLARNLKLPYDNFLLCFTATPTITVDGKSSLAKYAIAVQRYDHGDVGVTLDYLVSDGSKWWTVLPFTRVYAFNTTIKESGFVDDFEDVSSYIPDGGDISIGNTIMFPHVDNTEYMTERFIKPGHDLDVQKTLASVVNYFLLLYNQKYIVTDTVYKDRVKSKRKRNNTRIFNYKILSVVLPKSGKKYRYDQSDKKEKRIMPWTDVPGTWKTYTEDAPMFGNPKLFGDVWVPAHHRGLKQAGFEGKDYCVKVND